MFESLKKYIGRPNTEETRKCIENELNGLDKDLFDFVHTNVVTTGSDNTQTIISTVTPSNSYQSYYDLGVEETKDGTEDSSVFVKQPDFKY